MTPLSMRLYTGGSGLTLAPKHLIVAGYTGRDPAAVAAHVDELAAQGIAPPPSVPMFYRLDPGLLTSSPTVTVRGHRTSGEVEPVYLRVDGRWYLGVGSDHTDRDLEREDVTAAKAACAKPIGTRLVPLPDLGGAADRAWDAISASCCVNGAAYQHATLATLRRPGDILPRLFAALGDDGADIVVYGGTVPLRGAAFSFGSAWSVRLETPDGVTLGHEYTVQVSGGTEETGGP